MQPINATESLKASQPRLSRDREHLPRIKWNGF